MPEKLRYNPEANRSLRHHKKMTIVSYRESLKPEVVVFPEPIDKESFIRAHKSVKSYGSAERNPGSIGTLRLSQDSNKSKFFDVDFAQAHFKIERDKEKQGKTNKLPLKIARKYGGWRKEAMKEGIRIAMLRKKILRLDLSNLNMIYGKRESFLRDLGVAITDLEMSGQGSIRTDEGLWLKFGDERGEFVHVHEGCFSEVEKSPEEGDKHSLEYFLKNLHLQGD